MTHSRKSSFIRFAVSVMSSKRNERRSIASQLVLLFTLSATLLLSCSLGVFYWIVVRHAFEEDNAVLADKVAEIRADLKQPGGIETIDRESKSRRGGEPAAYWVRILDPAGVVVAETPGMDRLLPTKLFLRPEGSASILRSPQDYQSGVRL